MRSRSCDDCFGQEAEEEPWWDIYDKFKGITPRRRSAHLPSEALMDRSHLKKLLDTLKICSDTPFQKKTEKKVMRNGNETLFPKIEAILLCYPRTSKRPPRRWSACVNSLCKETRQRENKIKINFQVQVEITHISTDTHWTADHMMNAPGFLPAIMQASFAIKRAYYFCLRTRRTSPRNYPGNLAIFSVSVAEATLEVEFLF